jgi:phosphoribosylformimino-5-aminoimidazole carboxamide ribotide isomerase
MQIGGGINIDNASYWLDYGASAVIVTSWVFHGGIINMDRLEKLVNVIGKEHLVLDLSCRKKRKRLYDCHRSMANFYPGSCYP